MGGGGGGAERGLGGHRSAIKKYRLVHTGETETRREI